MKGRTCVPLSCTNRQRPEDPLLRHGGAAVLAAYGVVAALQPISEFGRVYAAYGGIFIALSLVWGVLIDGFRPDPWDLLGTAICVVGVVVMVAPQRD